MPRPGEGPRCAAELTEIHTGGEAWWTLGFEATGPVSLLRGELQAAAALVFAQALPGGAELGMDQSRSYQQWLRRRPAPEVTPKPEILTGGPTGSRHGSS